jgi:hypothetical protein
MVHLAIPARGIHCWAMTRKPYNGNGDSDCVNISPPQLTGYQGLLLQMAVCPTWGGGKEGIWLDVCVGL